MIHKVIMMICLFWLVDMYAVAKTGLMRARGNKYIYYIHFEINGVSCNLIG